MYRRSNPPSRATLFAVVKGEAESKQSEAAARNHIQKYLALVSNGAYTALPRVEHARDPKAGSIRIYTWMGSPAGDVVLVAGARAIPEVYELGELTVVHPSATGFAVEAEEVGLSEGAARSLEKAAQKGAADAAWEPTPRAARAPRAPRARPAPAPARAAPPPPPPPPALKAPRAPRARPAPAPAPAAAPATTAGGLDMASILAALEAAAAKV